MKLARHALLTLTLFACGHTPTGVTLGVSFAASLSLTSLRVTGRNPGAPPQDPLTLAAPSGTFASPYSITVLLDDALDRKAFDLLVDGLDGTGAIVASAVVEITVRKTKQVTAAVALGPPALCGDGIVAGFETCDDGNTVSNDGCSSICQTEAPPS